MKKNIRSLSALLFTLLVVPGFILSVPQSVSAEQWNGNTYETNQPEGLHPIVAERAEILRQRAAQIGIVIRFTDGFRSFEEQNALFAQGRTTAGNIVTNAQGGESYHNYGLAVDYALEVGPNVIWDLEYDGNGNARSDWFEVARIAKELGFTWGGDWESFRDYPHLQMDFGYSLYNLQTGNHYLY
ncbi:M15 family metallopeptidase [Salinicoccus sp. ID82-1]|uniref:M15 family metallopeptidase n=1 Tax=Salinicoccus sp. ID82-1 TaxID=2820269 RepID=UPI001F253812|nr:M15 family metallopeptidase [Salinicoccus sp. ID82-1]MCG1010119.1 M15 family metallopeptidase [Salinicoccus sp. ID82-1]